jgi:hypothetical protein
MTTLSSTCEKYSYDIEIAPKSSVSKQNTSSARAFPVFKHRAFKDNIIILMTHSKQLKKFLTFRIAIVNYTFLCYNLFSKEHRMNLISSTLTRPAKLFCFAVSAAAGYAATSNLIEKYAPTFQNKTACSGLLACAVSIPISQSKLLTGGFTALCVAYVMFYNHAQKQSPEVVQPKTIIAAGEVNQYSAGGSSACTPLACRFIASEDPASPEMLKKLIEAITYRGNKHLDTEKCIQDTGLIRAKNPWAWMAQEHLQATVKNETMQVTFGQNGVTDLTEAVKTLLGSNEINGAIITANAIRIGMRKYGDAVEFFDSHGDASRTHTDKAYGINTAYVIQFQKNQMDQMVEFLTRLFPNIVKNSHIQIWPIQCPSGERAETSKIL